MSGPLREHPDPIVECLLRILQRTAMALARCGCSADARARFDDGLAVGNRMGPPPARPRFALKSLATEELDDEPPPKKKDRPS